MASNAPQYSPASYIANFDDLQNESSCNCCYRLLNLVDRYPKGLVLGPCFHNHQQIPNSLKPCFPQKREEIQNVTAAITTKCDDDTFVRVDAVLNKLDGISSKKSLYMGNLNLLHRPLRNGKWAVTYEEWSEDIYPQYANGPGYVISSDIAKFIVSQHRNRSLRIFKMEDVSMGIWVEQFNSSVLAQYSRSWKFCQYGCMEDYYTAHYQSLLGR